MIEIDSLVEFNPSEFNPLAQARPAIVFELSKERANEINAGLDNWRKFKDWEAQLWGGDKLESFEAGQNGSGGEEGPFSAGCDILQNCPAVKSFSVVENDGGSFTMQIKLRPGVAIDWADFFREMVASSGFPALSQFSLEEALQQNGHGIRNLSDTGRLLEEKRSLTFTSDTEGNVQASFYPDGGNDRVVLYCVNIYEAGNAATRSLRITSRGSFEADVNKDRRALENKQGWNEFWEFVKRYREIGAGVSAVIVLAVLVFLNRNREGSKRNPYVLGSSQVPLSQIPWPCQAFGEMGAGVVTPPVAVPSVRIGGTRSGDARTDLAIVSDTRFSRGGGPLENAKELMGAGYKPRKVTVTREEVTYPDFETVPFEEEMIVFVHPEDWGDGECAPTQSQLDKRMSKYVKGLEVGGYMTTVGPTRRKLPSPGK